MKTPDEVVNQMLDKDNFTRWLGIEVIETGLGFSKLKMKITPEMLNGFGIAHGGITYSLADSALAFASNSRGIKAVSVETSISHLISLVEGDEIIAEAFEENCSNKIGVYTIKIYKTADNAVAALFKGTVYRTSKEW